MKRLFSILTLAGALGCCASAAGTPPITGDIAVIGGGSAGFAAAWSAAHLGSDVVLIEKEHELGGTSTLGGVNNWEPGMGATGVPLRVFQRLSRIPNAVGVYRFDRHCMWKKPQEAYAFPGGIVETDPALTYADTLLRHGPGMRDEAWFRAHCHGVIFEPDAMAATMLAMLKETGHCRVLLDTAFIRASQTNGRVESVTLSDGSTVRAKRFIDATDGVLCAQLGCELMSGRESRAEFGEPGAPAGADNRMNGATLVYRVTPLAPTAPDGVEPLPADVPKNCWWGRFPYAFVGAYPNGDRFVNMLPTLAGDAYVKLGPEKARGECVRRVYAHWHWLQSNYTEFRRFRLKTIFPLVGVRETRRVRGEYVLNQNDLIAGFPGQRHTDIIAIADHMMDSHGGGGPGGELKNAYGVPYRCLLPRGTENVLIAGRAASFSAIAASSCRLSRTMMQLGEAAGVAAHLSCKNGTALRSVPPEDIRRLMAERIDQSIPCTGRDWKRETPFVR